jgi:hypothetical protein
MSRPTIYDSPEVQASCKAIHKAAAEHYYPMVLTESQMKLVRYTVKMALEKLPKALRAESAAKDDIERDSATFTRILAVLSQAKAAHPSRYEPKENYFWSEL